jgi:hypothetical protein
MHFLLIMVWNKDAIITVALEYIISYSQEYEERMD